MTKRDIWNFTPRLCVLTASASLFFSILFGAYLDHKLKGRLSLDQFESLKTALRYLEFHGVALLSLGLYMEQAYENRLYAKSGWLMIVGLTIFSGSIITGILTPYSALLQGAPYGGFLLTAAWFHVFLGTCFKRKDK